MTERDYNQCVTAYADNVYRFVLKNIRSEEDAKDIVQSAYEKLWMKRQEVENIRSKSYLFTIAYNTMIDHIRKNKRIEYRESVDEMPGAGEESKNSSRRILQEALGKLNETQRSLVMLKDYEGYSYEEIGEIMSLNESQVKVYLHRARLFLRNYLVKAENII